MVDACMCNGLLLTAAATTLAGGHLLADDVTDQYEM